MASKEFKVIDGLANWETSEDVITAGITSNSATTIDTTALSSFHSIEYNITIVQGSKIRTSAVLVQTDGTSVDSTEYGIVATGGAISGVAITATSSAGNMLLQVTVTDAATTIARVRAVKNLLGVIQPYLPGAPTIGTATVATGQSYTGNANASVSFTAPADNGNSAITSYTVTSSSGNSVSGASSPLTVSELVGIARTYTVTANNSIGSSAASSTSNSVTPSSVPQAPTIGTVTATQGSVSVPFTAGATGGSAITSYTATSTSGVTVTGASSPIALTETVDGTYTYTVTATNANGTSAASSASNSIVISLIIRAGYIAGGYTSVNVATVDKFLFSNDSRSTLGTGLSQARHALAAMANSSAGGSGYVAGGSNGSTNVTTVDKFLFSDDSRSTLGTGLSVGKYGAVGFANSGTAGYINGGGDLATNKFSFSNDTRSTINTVGWNYSAGFANSGTAGYIAGGSVVSRISGIYKLLFSNDSGSQIATTISSARNYTAGFANSGTAGYVGGGNLTDGSEVSTIDKIVFSNDSRSVLSSTLSGGRSFLSGMANSGTAGYFAGAFSSTVVDKLLFSNESVSTLGTGLSSARRQSAGFANSSGL